MNLEADRAVSMSTGQNRGYADVSNGPARRARELHGECRANTRRCPRTVGQDAVSTRPLVLIVDDEATTRTLVRLLLERDGYRVIEAFNGRHALDVIGAQAVDLVVMDLLLPELDGDDAIRALRQHEQHATTLIVVVTTEEGPSVEEQLLDLGADDHILTPFEPTVLTSRIKAAFRRQRLEGC